MPTAGAEPILGLDPVSQAWIDGLSADGPEREPAIKRYMRCS